MRYLGVDPGSARLGLAVGDDLTGVVTPVAVVRYGDRYRAARAIADTMELHGATHVVIGLPTTADGDQTPACARSHALAAVLTSLGVEVSLQPELLTSDEARRRARSMGRDRGEPVDDIAAQIILEDFLQRIGRVG